MVLLFGRSVLSVKLWKGHIFPNSGTGRNRRHERHNPEAGMTFTPDHHTRGSKSQSLVRVKKSSKWYSDADLINKKVVSCEMVDIGYISMIENQLMSIIPNGSRQQQYVIPTYYIREYDGERVLIDTSLRYLDHYQVGNNVSNVSIP